MDSKHNLRRKIIGERKLLSGYEFQYENEAILANVNSVLDSLDEEFNDSTTVLKLQATDVEFVNPHKGIGLYLPFKGEPDLTKLMLQRASWAFGLPKLEADKMKFVHYQIGTKLENSSSLNLDSNNYGIRDSEKSVIKGLMQPSSNIEILPNVIIAPGLAYSIDGYRLGYGTGYYDKYLSYKKETSLIIKIGVCFDKYLLEYLPHQDHDARFDYIITDKIILKL